MTLSRLGDLLSHSSRRKLVPLLVKTPEEKVDAIWREFFGDPSQWDDNRATKISDKYPDFKHKTTKVALWVDKKCNPAWVKSELAALNRNSEQHESCSDVTYKLINDLCNQGQLTKALDILDNINGQTVKVDCYTNLLQGCIKFKALVEGKRLHAHIVQNELEQIEFISSTLVKMYASCGSLLNAQDTLNDMPSANSFSFNTLITAYCDCGLNEKALQLFYNMKRAEVRPDKYTFANVFKACANLKSLEEGEKARVYMDESGISSDAFLDVAIVNMYAKCGNLESARSAFDAMEQPNIVCWTSLIAGYAQSGNIVDALELFDQMQVKGVKPDVASCNAIISGFADNGHNDEALKFFQKMQKIGREPDKVTVASILKVCASLKNLEDGQRVHAYIVERGINLDAFLELALVSMYSKCGSLENACCIFRKISEPSLILWTALIAGYTQCGKNKEALELFEQMQLKGIRPDVASWNTLIAGHAQHESCKAALQIFERMKHQGFTPNIHSWNVIIAGYIQNGHLQHAIELFAKMLQGGVQPDIATYNAMITGYAKCGCMDEALNLFKKMRQVGIKPDANTWIAAFSGFARLGKQEEALILLQEMEQSGVRVNSASWNAIIAGLAQRGHLMLAYDMFQEMQMAGTKPNVASWTALISGFAQHGHTETGLELMKKMKMSGILPDVATWTALVAGRAREGCLEASLELFLQMQREGVKPDAISWTALIGGYARNGHLKDALILFTKMKQEGVEPSVGTWSTLIAGHASHGSVAEAKRLFSQMQHEGLKPNQFTWNSLISVLSHHGQFEEAFNVLNRMQREGIKPDVVSWNTLIAGYMHQGHGEEALKVLKNMESLGMKPNVITWTTIIAGYVQKGCGKQAIGVFQQMQHKCVRPSCVTYTSILSACTSVIARTVGKCVHSQMIEDELFFDSPVDNAVIDMYAKFGDIEDARFIFNRIGSRDIVAWTAIIAGYAMHGDGEEALQLLEKMRAENIKPNAVTFTSILSACSHAGLVKEGSVCFDSINQVFGLDPCKEHYACMVDLLGRAGHLKEAVSYIKRMSIPPHAVVWMALLGSCKIHVDVQLAEYAAEAVLKLEPDNASVYVLLSNIYAASGMHKERENLQKLMLERGIKRQPGRSHIEVDGEVHEFVCGDKGHPRTEDIYKRLNSLVEEMKAAGYKPDRLSVFQSMDDDDMEATLCSHSEKLAIAFGLISTPAKTTLRIAKNLRVCVDCHNATKFISRIVERKIIVRDANRIHCFKDGVCSCRDMW